VRPAQPRLGTLHTSTQSGDRDDESCLQAWKAHIVLGVWAGKHDRAWPSKLEGHPLEGRQARRLKMLSQLDHGCGIEAAYARITVQ